MYLCDKWCEKWNNFPCFHMKPWHYFVINYVKNYVKTHFYIMMWQFYLFYFVKVSCDFMWRFTWKIKKLSYFHIMTWQFSTFSHETITIFLERFMCFYGIIYVKNSKLSRKNVKLSRHDMILSLLCSVWQQYASIAQGPKVFSFFLVGSKALWETERDVLTQELRFWDEMCL